MTAERTRRWRLPWPAVTALDLLIVLTITISVVVLLSGAVRGRVGGLLFTASSPGRPAVAAVLLLVVRRVFARDYGPLGTAAGSTGRTIRRLIPPTGDRLETAGGSRRAGVLALAGYGIVAVFMLHAQLVQMRAVPDLGDPVFSMWRIGWVFQQLQGDPRRLFDANIFHPEPLTLTYSDSMLLTSLMAAPLLAAGLAPVVTYNVLLVVSFLLSALATYLLVVRLTGSARAAFIAGLYYGFHPFRFEHYSHLELQMTYWMPLALLALHRFIETRKTRDAVYAALCVAGQLYSSMYYAVFFPLYAAAVFGVILLLDRVPLRRLVVPAALAGVFAIALAIPLARPYSAAQAAKGDRPLTEVQDYSATPADYLRPHPRSALYGGHFLPPIHGERALFPGFAILILTVGALVPPIGVVRAAYFAGLVLAFDMSTGLNGVLYEPLYQLLSPLRGMRVAARFSVVLGISLAVLGAFGVRRLLAGLPTETSRRVVFAILVAIFIVELRPTLTLQPVWPAPPSTYSAIAGRHDVVLAEFPFRIHDRTSGWVDAMPQMYFSIWHGRPMVNGYSGFFPASYDPMLHTIQFFPGPQTLNIFRSRGVTHVTVTCALMHNKEGCDGVLEKIDASPDFRQVAASSWEGYPARLYELRR